VSDGVSPSPKEGGGGAGSPLPPPLNPPLHVYCWLLGDDQSLGHHELRPSVGPVLNVYYMCLDLVGGHVDGPTGI